MASSVTIKKQIPRVDTSSPKTQSISFLTSHLAKSDNHLWQALNSLQSQTNAIIGSFASICYGSMQERINADPSNLSLGSLWFVTDFPGAIYQVRNNTKDAKQEWFWAGGVIWLPDNSPFSPGYTLGPNDIGLMLARHGFLFVWDGVGPQLQCLIYGPCSAGGGGGNTGGGSNTGGTGGGGSGTGGTGPGSTNPIPPNVQVAGPVGNFQISNNSVDLNAQTVTATFSWTPPTTNASQYAGVQLWIVGGTTVSELGQFTTSPQTITIPFPSLGVEPLVVGAITIDSNIGITADPTTGSGQAFPTVIWNTGTGGLSPGYVQNLVIYPSILNPDGSYSAIVGWDNSSLTIFATQVQVWLVSTSGNDQVLASVSGQGQNIPSNTTITAPASAFGQSWTIAVVAINSVGTPNSQPSQAPTRIWVVGS